MNESKVTIGLTGVVHPNMPGDDEGIYAGIVQAMEKLKPSLIESGIVTPCEGDVPAG